MTPRRQPTPAPVETTASVDVHGDRSQLAAHDADDFESDAIFVR